MRFLSKKINKLENLLKYEVNNLGNLLNSLNWWKKEKGYVPNSVQHFVDNQKNKIFEIVSKINQLKEIENNINK